MRDTWGIPGPTFLLMFLAAVAVVLIGTLVHRRRLFAGPDEVRVDQLHPQQLAYLNGGPALAVTSSLTWLRQLNLVQAGDNGRLSRIGGLPAGATGLDAAVLHAAGQGLRAGELAGERSVAAALDGLSRELRSRGLTMDPDAARQARTGPHLLLALFALGVVRAVAGAANGRSIGLLVLALVPLLVLGLVLRLRRPRLTRAAATALTQARRQYSYLAPKQSPSWQTYGAGGTAMAVGLYGTAVLWSADPAFAHEAAIPNRHATGTDGSSGGYSCSSGSSDGGGSSDSGGSSDGGGGSSCGGGGGCGGGGCGG